MSSTEIVRLAQVAFDSVYTDLANRVWAHAVKRSAADDIAEPEDLIQSWLGYRWQRLLAWLDSRELEGDELEIAFEISEHLKSTRLSFPRNWPQLEDMEPEASRYWPIYLAWEADLDVDLIDCLVDGLSEQQMAGILGTSESTARRRKEEALLNIACMWPEEYTAATI